MLHLTCVTLVLMMALAEMTALRQWLQQRELAGIQQAATAAALHPIYARRN